LAQSDTMIDSRDGKTYKTIKIESQIWMAENLAYAPSITYLFLKPNITESGIYCFGDDTINCTKYGMLYTWEAAQNACPIGWHIPSENEFNQILANFGNDGKKAFKELVFGGNSGFQGLLGGMISHRGYGLCYDKLGSFWTSTKKNKDNNKTFILNKVLSKAYISSAPFKAGLSIRCIKD
jgi:uncharacterized protein (TIGR02145 family)